MRTCFDRLVADLRDAGRWIVLIFVAVVMVSSLTTYMALFAVAGLENGTLLGSFAGREASAIRVLDPEEAIVHAPDDSGTGFETPALQALLAAVENDQRISIVIPLSMLISDRLVSTDGVAPDARVVIQRSSEVRPSEGMLWGDLGPGGRPVVDDSHVATVALQQASGDVPFGRVVSGSGLTVDLADRPLILLSVSQAREVGFSGLERSSELLAGVTCHCAAADLSSVADAMTRAARQSGDRVVYYAVSRDGLVGGIQRAAGLSDLLDALQGVCAVLALALIGAMAGRLLWRRRSRVFAVEVICGARERAIQVRYHSLVAMCFAVPLVLGVELTNGLVSGSVWPPPLSSGSVLAVVAAACLGHTAIAGPNTWRIHKLCRYPTEG